MCIQGGKVSLYTTVFKAKGVHMQLSRVRKWSVMLLVICSIVSLFAGCGKKTPESTADPAVNQSESMPPEEEFEKKLVSLPER